MSERVRSFIDTHQEKYEGFDVARHQNFESETKNKNADCDPNIDGIGYCVSHTKTTNQHFQRKRGDIMAEEKVQDYTENENEEGHADTRHKNFECDTPDENLGCDPGIDVAG